MSQPSDASALSKSVMTLKIQHVSEYLLVHDEFIH